MAAMKCALCSTGFTARADAVYCSSACRQKAHRARTARRIAALGLVNRQQNNARPAAVRPDVARSIARAREQIAESRRLCRASAERLRDTAALQQSFGFSRELRAAEPMLFVKQAR